MERKLRRFDGKYRQFMRCNINLVAPRISTIKHSSYRQTRTNLLIAVTKKLDASNSIDFDTYLVLKNAGLEYSKNKFGFLNPASHLTFEQAQAAYCMFERIVGDMNRNTPTIEASKRTHSIIIVTFKYIDNNYENNPFLSDKTKCYAGSELHKSAHILFASVASVEFVFFSIIFSALRAPTTANWKLTSTSFVPLL